MKVPDSTVVPDMSGAAPGGRRSATFTGYTYSSDHRVDHGDRGSCACTAPQYGVTVI